MGATQAELPHRRRGRRRTYIINPAFQWKYTLLIAVGVFLVSALMSIVLYGAVHQQVRAQMVHLAPTHPLANTYGILLFAGGCAVLMAAGVGLWTVILTHRISGPLYVFRGYLAELAAGRWPRTRSLRRHDEFKDLFGVFRRAVNTMKAGKRADLSVLNEALMLARTAAETEGASREKSLMTLVAHLESVRDEVATTLGEVPEEQAPTLVDQPACCPADTKEYAEAPR